MPEATNKPVIFLAFANDRDDTVGYLRNLPVERKRLSKVLDQAEQDGLCEVVVKPDCTASEIFDVFQDARYRNRIAIFHYGGHANGYQLLLESAAGKAAAADAGGLAAFLAQQQGLQLVFLNGCSTQQQTQELLDANISAVISTSRSIDDQVATDFAYQFYQGLAGGATIRTAYREAEASVQMAKGGNTRALYFGDKDDSNAQLEADRWPWNLYLREGSENADQWNLPEAVNDPLFGLPPLPEQDLPESPYRHLNWFTRKDAEVFFGRGHQIRELYDRLTAPRTAPIMLFYGQSGVGKSSILDAGLIPRLEQDYDVRYLRRSEGGLLDTLRLAFLPEASDVPIETAWRVKEEQTGKPLLVFLDQIEELYTRPIADIPNELDQLLEVVKATFVRSNQRPRGKLVLGFRKEWLAELESQLVAFELPRTKVFLEPLDRRGIVEVVQGPARSERLRERYGLVVEDGLAEIIADDLLSDRDSAIAPTLQILLTKMWTKATEANYEHPQFSQDLYHDLKHDGILLRDFLNQQIAAFRERYPEAVDSGLLLDIVALHTTPLGTADQRTVEQLQQQYVHLGGTLPDLLQQCQDLHLLTVAVSTQKESTKTTRLAHDTLAPLVREQFDVSDKPGQRARRILDNRSVDWEEDREGAPLDEADLAVVEQGANGTRAMTPVEQRLLEASRRERAKRIRAQRNLRIAGIVVVLVILLFAAVAWWQRQAALKVLGENLVAKLFLFVDDKSKFSGIVDELEDYRQQALPSLKKMSHEFSTFEEEQVLSEDERIKFGKQQADAAIALFRLDAPEAAVELLRLHNRYSEVGLDPEPLTQFVHRFHERGVSSEQLRRQLYAAMLRRREARESGQQDDAAEQTVCYGLLLALGGDIEEATSPPDPELLEKLEDWYGEDPSSAIHSVCGWLLHKWGHGDEVKSADRQLAQQAKQKWFDATKEWFVLEISTGVSGETDYFTFVVFQPAVFMMGSPINEMDRSPDPAKEKQHYEKIRKPFALCDREVTLGQLKRLISEDKLYPHDPGPPDFPATFVTRENTQEYCRLLTKRGEESLRDREQAPPEFRLPLEKQWEYACRATTITPFSFGSDRSLFARYGSSSDVNGESEVPGVPLHEVATLRPNLRGLFDVHGNVKEWCEDAYAHYGVTPTQPDRRVVRGGGGSPVETCRSAARAGVKDPDEFVGFRLCVYLPESR